MKKSKLIRIIKEVISEIGTPKSPSEVLRLFTQGYIHAALWIPNTINNKEFYIRDISNETLRQIANDCLKFNNECTDIKTKRPIYQILGWNPVTMGMSFYFSRNKNILRRLEDIGAPATAEDIPTFYSDTSDMDENKELLKQRSAKYMTDVAEGMGSFELRLDTAKNTLISEISQEIQPKLIQNKLESNKNKEILIKFTKSYIDAAIWSSTNDDGNPLDKNYTKDDICKDTLITMANDCLEFNKKFMDLYLDAGWTPEEAGHDFWLTRNGHGTGFWDRGYNDEEKELAGKELTKASKLFGEYNLYLGDGEYDGLLCGS